MSAGGPSRGGRRWTWPTVRRGPMGLAVVAAVVLGAAAFAPTVRWLVETWLVHPYYSHGPLLVATAAWLAWRAVGRAPEDVPDDRGLALMAVGVAVHLAALRWAAWPLSAGAALVVLAGAALVWRGRPLARALALPLLLAGLAVPLPLVERLAPPLAGAVSAAAAAAAGGLGVDVVRTGAQLAVGDGAFVVGAPCSGLRSLVALVSLAVLLAGTTRLGPRRGFVLVASAVPLAMIGSWARLTALIVAAEAMGAARGLDLVHEPAGPLAFAAALGGLAVVGRALGWEPPGVA